MLAYKTLTSAPFYVLNPWEENVETLSRSGRRGSSSTSSSPYRHGASCPQRHTPPQIFNYRPLYPSEVCNYQPLFLKLNTDALNLVSHSIKIKDTYKPKERHLQEITVMKCTSRFSARYGLILGRQRSASATTRQKEYNGYFTMSPYIFLSLKINSIG